ncbi:restriction endonuclease [Heyndrickxia sp. MSNUG]|uniref:restriction endonuclease n=1 Tax=Heyndrickxia sp. MSNUG TaxID=3136677 RepID=UPI003C2C54AF
MLKLIRKIEKNFSNYSLATIFIYCWFAGTFNFIEENPKEIATGIFMLLIPFFVLLTYKPVRKKLFEVIRVFIKSLKFRNGIPVDIEEIDKMDGFEFEHFLKPIFERQGYVTTVTQGSSDYGADLILRKGHKKYVVQAKRYSSNIGVGAVQQVVGAIRYYRASGAIVVTNQYFTPAAIELAKVNKVRLIDRDKLAEMVR